MNRILLTTALVAIAYPALADDFYVAAPITAATVYPDDAQVTHTITYDLPAGDHRLLVPAEGVFDGEGVPNIDTPAGLTIGALAMQYDVPVDPERLFTPAQIAAKAALEALEDKVIAQQDRIATAEINIAALETQNAFITAIRPPKDGASPEDLLATATLVQTQAGATLTAIAQARQALRQDQEQLGDLQSDLAQAQTAFARLGPASSQTDLLVIEVTADGAQSGQLSVQGDIDGDASWTPIYDLHFGADDSLILDRNAAIWIETSSPWHNVAVTLSSAPPNGQLEPRAAHPNQARIYTPEPELTPRERSEQGGLSSPIIEDEPIIVAEASSGFYGTETTVDGVAVTYAYPRPLSLADGEGVILTLDSLTIPVGTEIHASPRRDDTAFLMARITNDTGEPLLPGTAQIFREGHFLGTTRFPLVPAGAEATLPMGPIEGLRLNHVIARNETGDTGILSRSNTREQQNSFSVENLTGEAQDLTAFYPLTFSEQEDLRVNLSVTPKPDATDIDDKRGVSSWDMSLAPGETQTVNITIKMDWPEGQELRWYP